ncbi:MAG: enoyl-CoA hydratase/isomerase family protein [Gammaproteobacteria bacterium]
MSNDVLLVDLRGGILTLTINRPRQSNALRMDLLDGLGQSLADHVNDESVKCAVITAAGSRCFAAGGDLKELDAVRTPEQAEAMSKRGRRALDQVRQFPVPVVGALNGLALGGGAELAMACDLRVAAPGAEIGFLQGGLNVTTAWGGGIDLVAAVGGRRALELLTSARRVKADEALVLGIVDRVCAPGETLPACLAEYLAPCLSRTRRVLEGFKAITTGHRQAVHERLSGIEQRHFLATWTHDDHWAAAERAAARRPGS